MSVFAFIVVSIVALFGGPALIGIAVAWLMPLDEPKNYDDDNQALVGVNHPTNRLSYRSRQVD